MAYCMQQNRRVVWRHKSPQNPSVYAPPSMWQTKFDTHTEKQVTFPKRMVSRQCLRLVFRMFSVRISAGSPDLLAKTFSGFSQSFQEIPGIVPRLGHNHFPSDPTSYRHWPMPNLHVNAQNKAGETQCAIRLLRWALSTVSGVFKLDDV
jgi:hypothetical protein